jgi:hypothetical protein
MTAHARWIQRIGISSLATILAGCGGHHDGGTTSSSTPSTPSTPSTTPVVSDLGVATSAQGCTVQALPGKVRTVTFSFTDVDGNERGGHVDLTLAAGGPAQSLTVGVPSAGVTLAGTTAGTITVSGLCITVIGGSATLTVTLTDAAGNESNTLSAAVAGLRPAGPSAPNQAPSAAMGAGLSRL